MTISSGSGGNLLAETGIDANTGSVTASVSVGDGSLIGLYVSAASGAHSTHVVTLQISPDGTKWFDTTHTITGAGQIHNITCVADEVRASVTTSEGAASTIDIDIIAR